jgi:uracil-DNA glycosylase family 4
VPSIDADCELCPLHQTCRTVCLAHEGADSKADVLFVGSAPGWDEDEQGRPFTGSAGRLLRQAFETFGLRKYRLALTYAVKCRPPADKKEPSVKEVRACSMYLEDEIATLKPRLIVPLGNVALRALTGKTGVTKYVGRLLPHPSGASVFPMLDPAAVFHDAAKNQPTFEAGFEMLARALEGRAATTLDLPRVDLDTAIKRLETIAATKAPFTIDIETGTELADPHGNLQGNPHFADIDCFAFAWGTGRADVAWCEWPTAPRDRSRLLAALHRTFTSGATMIAHNATFEVKWFLHRLKAARTFRWRVEDTLLFHHLLDENQRHGLEVLASQLTDMGGYDNEVALLLAEGKTHHQIWKERPETLGRYCAGDALATFKAWKALRPQLFDKDEGDEGLVRVWNTVTKDAIFSVAWAELHGRKVDFDTLGRLREKWKRESDEALAEVLDDPAVKGYVASRERAGKPLKEGFNPGSAQQVGAVLFKTFRIPVLGETETGQPSVKAEYIQPFAKKHPWIEAYLTWKGRQKALEKIAEAEALTAPDCFLYGHYLIFGTVTGRLSSADPNLQNFSTETRQIVVSRFPDGVLVEADYSQLELRLFAEASGCEPLLRAFREGLDPHAMMAARMYGKRVEDVTKDERFLGKTANFLLWNQGGPARLRVTGGLAPDVADEVYELFHKANPEARKYARKMEYVCRAAGAVRSAVGRLRRLPDIHSHETGVMRAAAREASNAPVQGTASDLNTWAFNRTGVLVAQRGMRALPLGVTHDSQLYDCPKVEVAALAGILRQTMVREAPRAVCPDIRVPFDIEVKVGPSWGNMEVYKEQPAVKPVAVR